jgi:hypothetical protein
LLTRPNATRWPGVPEPGINFAGPGDQRRRRRRVPAEHLQRGGRAAAAAGFLDCATLAPQQPDDSGTPGGGTPGSPGGGTSGPGGQSPAGHAPGSPSKVKAKAKTKAVVLTWQAPAVTAVADAATSYRVQVKVHGHWVVKAVPKR